MGAKPVVIGLSMLLVVGVAIGLIVGVHQKDQHATHSDDVVFATASKSVKAVCGPTDYKSTCVHSLSSLTNNNTATPKDFIELAINVTLDALQTGIQRSGVIGQNAESSVDKMSFKDCVDLLTFAEFELTSTYATIKETGIQKIGAMTNDLNNWVSAATAYQQTCIDQIESDQLKEQLQKGLQNTTELTSNALAMVTDFQKILKNFGPQYLNTNGIKLEMIPPKSASSTIGVDDHDNKDYPGWVSPTERKLLEVRHMGKMPDPNVVVDINGSSGKFNSINDALAKVPKKFKGKKYIIYVKAGTYKEHVIVKQDNIFMYGDGPKKTIVTGNLSIKSGYNTINSATFAVVGNGFICKSMGFSNTAGPEGLQAVALRVQSDKSVFYNVRVDGYQSSLFVQTHRQFYRNCVISGTVDTIFGDSSTIIQNSLLIARMPMSDQSNLLTAQGKSDRRENTAIVIHNCRIVPDQKLFPNRFKTLSFLGRPMKQFATTVVMESTLADYLHPQGWLPTAGDYGLDTLYFAEFENRGPGAVTEHRVDWKGLHLIDRDEAMKWTIGAYLQGQSWIPGASTPFILGLRR